MITITVVPLSSTTARTTHMAEIHPSTTIKDLKTLLQQNYNIPTHQQLLLLPISSPSNPPSTHQFTSPYGLLLPLQHPDTVLLSDSHLSSSTLYLSLRLHVHLVVAEERERDFFVDLKWGCTIGNLLDQVKVLTKISTHEMSVSWGTLKFGPYKDSTLESLCVDLWENPTQSFVVEVVPYKKFQKKAAIISDLEDGQLDTDPEDEGFVSAFSCEHRRKYNEVGPLLDKHGTRTYFGVQYKKRSASGRFVVVDALDPPGVNIPLPEGLAGVQIVKDPEIKFVILWLGNEGWLENLLARFNFHKKSTTRCVVVKGVRDVATYCFLRKLKADLVDVPICAVTDCDPCSLKVFAFLRHALVEFPPRLQRQFGGDWRKMGEIYGAMTEIKWIGLRPSYKRFYQMEKVEMKQKYLRMAKEFLEEKGFIGMFPEWAEELRLMIEGQEMAKVEAFSGFGEEYFSSVFLIEELGKHRCCRIKSNHVRR